MKKVIFSVYKFCTHTFIIFSVTILTISLLALVVGESAKELSTLFALGSKGLAFSTIAQLFGMSLIITILNEFILESKWLEKTMALWRIIIMLTAIVITVICFILMFGWFPIDNVYAWIGFALSFGSGFGISTAVMTIKTKMENQKYERSFLEYKQKHKEADEDEQHHA